MALSMKGECEGCATTLTPSGIAFICTFECTWCATCAERLRQVCPNCAGELVRRPRPVTKD